MTETQNLGPDRFVREPERRKKTGISTTRWWELEQEGKAPRRRRLGARMVAWLESEIDAWIQERARDTSAPPRPGTRAA